MFDWAKFLIGSRQFKLNHGNISILNQPFYLMPVSFYGELQKTLFEAGRPNDFYFASKKSGFRWLEGLEETFGTGNKEKVMEWSVKTIQLGGAGKIRFEYNLKKKVFLWDMHGSPIAKYFGPDFGHAVDHLVRGYGASAASYLLGEDYEAIELTCEADGAGICKFEVFKKDKVPKKYRDQIKM